MVKIFQIVNGKMNHSFFKLQFIDYAVTVVLIFPTLPSSTQRPPPPRQLPQAFPSPLFISIGQAYKFSGYSISYTVVYIPMAIL